MNTQIIFKHTEGKPTSLKSLMFFLHTFMSFYPQGYCVYTVFIHTSVSYYISWSDANSNCFWNPRTSLLFKFAAFFNVFHAEGFLISLVIGIWPEYSVKWSVFPYLSCCWKQLQYGAFCQILFLALFCFTTVVNVTLKICLMIDMWPK